MIRFFNTSGLNYYNKIFNTIEFINNNISNDISFDTLENISVNPEYIEEGPLVPLENEECPSPIVPSILPVISCSELNIDNTTTSIIPGNVSTTINTFNSRSTQPVITVKPAGPTIIQPPVVAATKPIITVKPSVPPIASSTVLPPVKTQVIPETIPIQTNKPVTQPMTQPVTQPMTQPVTQPVTQPMTQPVTSTQ